MNQSKSVLAGFFIGLMVAVAPACGPAVKCSPTTCPTGCCDSSGTCQQSSQSTCGQLGQACTSCQLGQTCNLGTCVGTQGGGNGSTGGGNGSTGGGSGTTGGGSGTTGGGSGTTGGGDGTTGGGTGTTGGGNGTTGGGTGTTGGGSGTTGGGTGTTGGGTGACDGCFSGTFCVIRANSDRDSTCGQGGQVCAVCSGGQTCDPVSRTCVGGSGGGTGTTGGGTGTTGGGTGTTGGGTGTTGGGTGTTGGGTGTAGVGTPCNTTAQCAGLAGGYCKLQTTPFSGAPVPYPSGFCTVNCTTSCPGGSVCGGGVSSFPYLFNETDRFCTPSCTGAGQCTNGQECIHIQELTASTPVGGCFMPLNTANFRGGGNPTKAGNACTTTTDCANPPDPVLAGCATNGFPNGYCLASSDYAPPDTWCTGAGKVEVSFTSADGGADYYCVGTCNTPGAVGSSRAGYTCYGDSLNPTSGILWPKCTSAADCGGTVPACNTTTGFCCDTATGTTNCAFNFR